MPTVHIKLSEDDLRKIIAKEFDADSDDVVFSTDYNDYTRQREVNATVIRRTKVEDKRKL